MMMAVRRLLSSALVLGCFGCGVVLAQVNVTTQHNDIARTGQNTQETILTPANVNSAQFGRLYSLGVDGYVYAQPLYVSSVSVASASHNVLYVATEHDSIYAIDADTGAILVHKSLLPSGGTPVNSVTDLGCEDLIPEVGITGTPVIDTSTGTLYVVAKSKVAGNIVQYLHALDISTLSEKFGGPMPIVATAAGSAPDASGGVVSFNSKQENQRPALLLDNGHVVVAFGSHCDVNPYHGWVISYSASSLAQEAVLNLSPNGGANAVWMSGGGLAADTGGNIFFATGNGTWDGTIDFGDSVVKIGPPASGKFPVLDYFTAYNQASLSNGDIDLGSGGLVLLPTVASGKQLLVQMGKQGTMYVLDRANLGKYCGSACTRDTQITQEIASASTGIWGVPAYWNGNVYWSGANDTVKAFSVNGSSGALSSVPTSHTSAVFGYFGVVPSISSNGTSAGILWGLYSGSYGTCSIGSSCAALYAYDATNLGNLLYNSNQATGNRDTMSAGVKFATPTIANGKVFVAGQSAVYAFGILGSTSTAANPTVSPASGTYSSAQTVRLSDTTSGAMIYYTTNGTTPTTSSAKYSTPLSISTTTTIKAIAVAGGYANSAVTSATFTISQSTTGVSVNLSSIDNVHAVSAVGTSVAAGGIDNYGDAYAANLLGTSVTWSGSTFAIGSAGVSDAVSSTTVALPAGSYSSLKLLGTSVNNSQLNQVFVVTYTDGTTSSFTQSLSDWGFPQGFGGESTAVTMGYRLNPAGANAADGSFYLYGYAFAINSSKVVKSLTLPNNRNVVVLAIDLAATDVSVNLSAIDNVHAVAAVGTAVAAGGIDNYGDAYAANLLGTSVSWSGSTFAIGGAGAADAVSSTTVALPAGSYSSIKLLGTSVNASQLNQAFVVTYTDGSTTSFTQSLSDWGFPQGLAGESTAVSMAYRLNPVGANAADGSFYVYGYTFAINSAKTVKSLTLPNNRNVVVLAVDLKP